MQWVPSPYDFDVVFTYYGRQFTLSELRRAVIASCGGTLNQYVALYEEMYLEDVIEDIEIVSDLNQSVKML